VQVAKARAPNVIGTARASKTDWCASSARAGRRLQAERFEDLVADPTL